jgi:translation initiation factor 4A
MDVVCYLCIGGRKVVHDIRALNEGVHIIVGTVGRVIDVVQRGALKPEKIKILCIDEADEMLSNRGKSQVARGRSFVALKDFFYET